MERGVKFNQKKSTNFVPCGKRDQRAYAIGDVHGCLDELKQLLQTIKKDNDYRNPAKTYLIFLGDLIDRGPESKGVIDLLIDFPYSFAEPLFIMGNHEEMLLRGLRGEPKLLIDWLEYGGYSCVESYGASRSDLQGQTLYAVEYQLRSMIPARHLAFLSGFLDYVQFGDYVFTHAGIRPGVPLSKQQARDLRWIRAPFLEYEGDHGAVIVHGHTATDEIVIRRNRIGMDTGAYKTGCLSAICIENEEVAFLSSK